MTTLFRDVGWWLEPSLSPETIGPGGGGGGAEGRWSARGGIPMMDGWGGRCEEGSRGGGREMGGKDEDEEEEGGG